MDKIWIFAWPKEKEISFIKFQKWKASTISFCIKGSFSWCLVSQVQQFMNKAGLPSFPWQFRMAKYLRLSKNNFLGIRTG